CITIRVDHMQSTNIRTRHVLVDLAVAQFDTLRLLVDVPNGYRHVDAGDNLRCIIENRDDEANSRLRFEVQLSTHKVELVALDVKARIVALQGVLLAGQGIIIGDWTEYG